MNRRELADELSLRVRAARLRRIGVDPDSPHVGLEELPAADQQVWFDVADAVLALWPNASRTDRLRALADDWDYYATIADEEERKSWHRCVLIELAVELRQLCALCDSRVRL